MWKGYTTWHKFAGARRAVREHKILRDVCATKVQSVARMFFAKRFVKDKAEAARRHQAKLKAKKKEHMEFLAKVPSHAHRHASLPLSPLTQHPPSQKAQGKNLSGLAGVRMRLKKARAVMGNVNPFRMSDTKAASLIQRNYRGHRTRRRLYLMRKAAHRKAQVQKLQHRARCVLFLQMKLRALIKRRRKYKAKINSAANDLQRLWRGYKGRQEAGRAFQLNRAARLIQGRWRGRTARMFMAALRERRKVHGAAAVIIQHPCLMWLAVRRVERIRDERRAERELELVGDAEVANTARDWTNVLLQRALGGPIEEGGVLKTMYEFFVAFGSRAGHGKLGEWHPPVALLFAPT